MKMKVVDQLHISSVGPEVMGKGKEFEVSAAVGKELEKKGHAVRVDQDEDDQHENSQEPAQAEKAEEAPANKAEPAPANKAEHQDGRRRKRG